MTERRKNLLLVLSLATRNVLGADLDGEDPCLIKTLVLISSGF